MARGHRRRSRRFRSGSWRWHWRNRWTHRRLGNDWAWRGRNLCGLRRRDDHRLRNRGRRGSRRGLCFDGACRRSGRPARHRNNRSRGCRNRGRRRSSYHGRLHPRRSGGRIFRCLFRYGLLFGLCLCISEGAKVFAHLDCGRYLNRAGMRFFLGDAGFGQIVDDGLCLDLELASQFVDSDLVRIGHCPPGRLLFSVLV